MLYPVHDCILVAELLQCVLCLQVCQTLRQLCRAVLIIVVLSGALGRHLLLSFCQGTITRGGSGWSKTLGAQASATAASSGGYLV
jgi:hypothetical protein